MVPEGWKRTTLESLIEVKHGFAFKSEFFAETGKHVLMTPGHFYEDGGFRDQGEKTKYYCGEIPDGYLLKKGDVLLAMTEQAAGLLGSAAYVPEDGRYLHNQRLGLIKVKEKSRISVDFLYWLYNHKDIRKQISEQASGTKVKHTSPERLTGVIALVPPLDEQEKIASILSSWEQAITTTEKLLANSQKQKNSLMQQLFSGKKRLPGYTGSWHPVKLGLLLNEEKSRNGSGAISRVLSVTNHSGFVLPEEQFSKRVASEDVSNYRVVSRGQFGYNPSRLNVGSFARLDKYESGILSPMYVVFSVNQELLDGDYLLFWMRSNEAQQRVKSSTQGSVRDSVGFDALASFPFKLPTLGEQKSIAQVLSAADREIETLQKQLAGLKQEKKALMQQLLTGKRRVKIDET